ncbi:MAG: lysophospholipid acyltransferase family protein, partial [Gemmatimonadaceae bacterium]
WVGSVTSDALPSRPSRRVVWLARLGTALIRVLGLTWRVRVSHDHDVRRFRAARQPIVFMLWHGNLLPLLYHHRNEGAVIVISEHADGEIIARIAENFGFDTVRGSTSRGAARALLGAARVVEEGRDLAVTPDGPRGPARSIAPGAAVIAQRTGAPVIGAAASTTRAWRLKSWDAFLIPKPFATVRIAYSDETRVVASDAREAADDANRLRAVMDTAEQRTGG